MPKLAKSALQVCLSAVVVLATTSVSHAANVTTTATINGGTLSLATSAAQTLSATLDGTDKTPTYTLPMTIVDSTGTGNGWNVTVTSTTFYTGGGTPKTLSTSGNDLMMRSCVCISSAAFVTDISPMYPSARR